MATDLVFLVEDDEDVRDLLHMDLSEHFEVMAFASAKECLDKIPEEDRDILPDLFITDFRMPDMDGLQFISALKNRQVERPYIVVTGAANKKMAVDALGLGVFCILEKPCSSNEIFVQAKKAIAHARSLALTARILDSYQYFIKYIDDWSSSCFDHIVQLENRIYEQKMTHSSAEEANHDLKVRRRLRLAEKTVRETKGNLETMISEYQKLKSIG